MKRYKIPITLLFVVLAFTALFVPLCSAASEYMYSLKELIDAGQLYTDIDYHNNSEILNQTVSSNTTHWSEAVRLYLPDLSSSGSFTTQVNIITNNNTLFNDLPNNSVLSMKTGRFVFASPSFSTFITNYPDDSGLGAMFLKISFRVLMEDGTFKYIHAPLVKSSSIIKNEPSFRMPAFEFPKTDFEIHLPDTATSVYSITFSISSSSDDISPSGTSYFMMWGGKAEFFVGDIASAPIYEGPDTSGYDEYHASEDALLNDTADGRESVDSAIDNGFTALAPGGTLYNSMYFWRELMNDAINRIPMLSPMITVSLSFGLVVFILGGSLIKLITKEPDDKVSRKRGKGG